MTTHFHQRNDGWNAEPNDPDPTVHVEHGDVVLTVLANAFQFPRFAEGQRLRLRFRKARRYRLGATNDEGWTRGQCRFSGLAPRWGEFYEITGDRRLERCPDDWHAVDAGRAASRHFLFYLRDATFECEAEDWALEGQAG